MASEVVLLGPAERLEALACPLMGAMVAAGFPNPADDFLEGDLDLAAYLVRNQPATFFLRVRGDSMIGAGIADGDLLVVDKSVTAGDGSVVIAVVGDEFVCKRLRRRGARLVLEAENPRYPTLAPAEFTVWGVVTFTVHQVRRCSA